MEDEKDLITFVFNFIQNFKREIFYTKWENHLISDKFFNERNDIKSDKYFKHKVSQLEKKKFIKAYYA